MDFIKDNVEEIVNIIKEGKTILYPTDTIWGIGCDPFQEKSIQRIYEIKGRPTGKNFIILVESMDMLKSLVGRIHPKIENLLEFHQKPLTVIYPKAPSLPDFLKSQNGSIAIRICHEPFVQQLLFKLGSPIVSTSANVSGKSTPAHFGEISSDIIENVDYIFHYRRNDKRSFEPSSIIALDEEDQIEFLRD